MKQVLTIKKQDLPMTIISIIDLFTLEEPYNFDFFNQRKP